MKVEQVDVSAEHVQSAEIVKEKANDYFKKKQFQLALEHYSEAIDLNPTVAVYYANRSFANLKLENYGSGLLDATKAIEVDKDYIKAYYRRATAYMALGKFKLALKDYDEVRHKKPADKDARDKYNECNKIVKREAFERAIAVDHKNTSIVDSIDLSSMSIEDEYVGPKLEDGKVSAEFINHLTDTYNKQKKLHSKYAYQILLSVREYFSGQPTLVDVPIPDGSKFTVCGDIHGQYYDLINVFNLNGQPSQDNPYLFNGDFVDRGSFSVECIFILFSYKLLYPNHFFMSRGNHESAMMNQMYGFEGEVKSKYSSQMADLFTEVYNLLPLCHCLNKKILVMHGGLFSKDDVTLDDIRNLNRNRQPPDEGLMCELLWSDPIPSLGRSPSKRGVGIQFGPDVTENFCSKNNLSYVIRSHEVKAEGYEVTHNNKCITVFSAPNYCDTMGNKGAFITLKAPDLSPKFTSYDAVPHPNIKPMAYANSMLSLFGM